MPAFGIFVPKLIGQLAIRNPAFLASLSKPTAQSSGTFTFIDSDGTGVAAAGTSVATPGITVAVGDLVVVSVGWDGGNTTCSVSDGTSSLTEWTPGVKGNSINDAYIDLFYIFASVASGTNSVIYTASLGASRTNRSICAMVYRPSGGASTDGTAITGNGNSASLNSGNITTAGPNLSFGLSQTYGRTTSNEQINSVAFEHRQEAGAINCHTLWSLTSAAGFTGQASATITSDFWVCGVAGFKI